jgi:hypothetical protein
MMNDLLEKYRRAQKALRDIERVIEELGDGLTPAKPRIIVDSDPQRVTLHSLEHGNYVCETHHDRELCDATLVSSAMVHDETTEPWQIFVTDGGWCIGDAKIMVATVPGLHERHLHGGAAMNITTLTRAQKAHAYGVTARGMFQVYVTAFELA